MLTVTNIYVIYNFFLIFRQVKKWTSLFWWLCLWYVCPHILLTGLYTFPPIGGHSDATLPWHFLQWYKQYDNENIWDKSYIECRVLKFCMITNLHKIFSFEDICLKWGGGTTVRYQVLTAGCMKRVVFWVSSLTFRRCFLPPALSPKWQTQQEYLKCQ